VNVEEMRALTLHVDASEALEFKNPYLQPALMRLAYILPISPIPMIPTVILLSEFSCVAFAGPVEQAIMIAKQIVGSWVQIELCDVRARKGILKCTASRSGHKVT